MLATSDEEADIKLACALGANAYMHKPAKRDTFCKQMELLGIYWAEHVAAPGVALP